MRNPVTIQKTHAARLQRRIAVVRARAYKGHDSFATIGGDVCAGLVAADLNDRKPPGGNAPSNADCRGRQQCARRSRLLTPGESDGQYPRSEISPEHVGVQV